MCKVYGYCRISRRTQNIERQIRNILAAYPRADIKQEAFTGTKVQGRKKFEWLLENVNPGDTIVFDSVSRMSRNAEEGFEIYKQLFDKGVNLVFLKERHIDTDTYRQSMKRAAIPLTGEDVDLILVGINNYLMELAKRQIMIAFEQAEKEVTDLHERTKEGIETARKAGKQIGQVKGAKLTTKKSIAMKEKMRLMSKDFEGNMTDKMVMETLGIARNTYYKYKKELILELATAE